MPKSEIHLMSSGEMPPEVEIVMLRAQLYWAHEREWIQDVIIKSLTKEVAELAAQVMAYQDRDEMRRRILELVA